MKQKLRIIRTIAPPQRPDYTAWMQEIAKEINLIKGIRK